MYHLTDSSTDCPAIDSVVEALSTGCRSTTSTGLHINHYNQEHSTDGLSTTTEIGLRHCIHEDNMDADTLVVIEAFGNDQLIGSYFHDGSSDTNFNKVEKWLGALQDIQIGEKFDHDIGSATPSVVPSDATSASEDNASSAGESHASYTKKTLVLKVSFPDDKTKQKYMKRVSRIYGIESISMNEKGNKLTMIGNVDPVNVVWKLRKVSQTEIISVGPPKKPKRNDQSERKKDPKEQIAELSKAYVTYKSNMSAYFHVPGDENPNGCVIC